MAEEIKVHVVDRGRKYLYLRYVDPETGKGIERSSRCASKKEAQKEAGKWEDELRSGRYKPRSRITWEEFRERYEREVLAGRRLATQWKATGVLDSFEKEIKVALLAKVTSATISRYQAILRDRELSEFTIKGHLSVLRALLNWAAAQDLIPKCPKFDMPKRAKTAKVMKGRPITGEEFERMLAAISRKATKEDKPVRPPEEREQWERLLRGLWWSGLRIGEALNLSWDRDDRLRVILAGEDSLLRIPGDCQKNGEEHVCPIAPEFVAFLEKTPLQGRAGYVFKLPFRRKDTVIKVISAIGEKAGVIVDRKPTSDPEKPKLKFASAHDLRRSFGERWKHRVMPPVLQELMRHADIQTTMLFYTDKTAKNTGKLLWQAARIGQPAGSDTFSDTATDTKSCESPEVVSPQERTAQDSNLQPSVP